MARVARSEVFDPREVSVLHCINRCVRACHLCGYDPLTGSDYDHRKLWIEQRLQFLAGSFAIDVLGFAVMSNHFHVILRNRPDIVDGWSDTEVARRWWMLCPARKTDDGQPEEPTQAELVTGFGHLFHRVAGSPASVAREATRRRGSHRFRNPGGRLLDAGSRHG